LKIDFLMKIQSQEGWLILKNPLKKTRKTIEKSIENTIDFSIDFCNVKNLGWTALFSHSFNLKQTWAGQLCFHTVSKHFWAGQPCCMTYWKQSILVATCRCSHVKKGRA